MSITEGQRHALHEGLVEAVGRERAETLMSMLPPVGWADVATKQDLDIGLDHLQTVMNLRFEVTENRISATLHEELRKQLWGILGGTAVSLVAAVILNAVLT